MIHRYLIVLGAAFAASLWAWFSVTETTPTPSRHDPPALETFPSQSPAPSLETAQSTEAAIRRSLAVLQTEGVAWFEGRTRVQNGDDGCVSCHQVPFGVWGLQEAERAGLVQDAVVVADLTRRAIGFASRPDKARTMSWGPLILATEADISTEAEFVEFLLRKQTADGYWEAKGQFPRQKRNLDETNAVASMWTILALAPLAQTAQMAQIEPMATEASLARSATPPADPSVAESIARAARWVDGIGEGESTEWLMLRFLTLEVAGEAERAAKLREELLLQQNADGGWSWLPGEASNALSTGQVLYSLHLNKGPTGDPERDAVTRAVEYLAAAQGEDGLWKVSSALTSQKQSDDRDYIYTYWGTAWATIGLAKSLGRSTSGKQTKPRIAD